MKSRDRPLVVGATTDLFEQSRINELASSLGLKTEFTIDEEKLRRLVSSRSIIVILDLSSTQYDPMSLVKMFKEQPIPPKILGFYPHVRKDLEVGARNAGIDLIVPNSAFLKTTRAFLQSELERS